MVQEVWRMMAKWLGSDSAELTVWQMGLRALIIDVTGPARLEIAHQRQPGLRLSKLLSGID
jgi:hypothetical protein